MSCVSDHTCNTAEYTSQIGLTVTLLVMVEGLDPSLPVFESTVETGVTKHGTKVLALSLTQILRQNRNIIVSFRCLQPKLSPINPNVPNISFTLTTSSLRRWSSLLCHFSLTITDQLSLYFLQNSASLADVTPGSGFRGGGGSDGGCGWRPYREAAVSEGRILFA